MDRVMMDSDIIGVFESIFSFKRSISDIEYYVHEADTKHVLNDKHRQLIKNEIRNTKESLKNLEKIVGEL